MAIINCPSCQGKLKFPDDSPPRRVKCPACNTNFMAGPQGPVDGTAEKSSLAGPPPLPPKKEESARNSESVIDKRSRTDDDRRRDDDDDRERRKRREEDEEEDRIRKKRRDAEDEADRDRKGGRRDDDDEDSRDRKIRRDEEDDRDRERRRRRDEEDDDRDRGRRSRRDDDDDGDPIFRRKGRRDDDDDDYDDDDRGSRSRGRDRRDDDYDDRDSRSRKKARRDDGRITRTQWEWARKGISFVNYGFYCQLGSFGGLALFYLIAWLGGYEPVILALACLPGLVGFILQGVGIGFIVAGPRRGNLLGFSIALAATAGVHLLLMLIAAFGDKTSIGSVYSRSSVNWLIMSTSYLQFVLMVTSKYGGDALIICTGLFEIARFVLLMLYLKELGKVCKEREAAGRCTMLLIALPSAVLGSILVALLGFELLKEANPSITFFKIFFLLYLLVKFGAYAFIYMLAIKTANEISDAAYKMY